MIQLTDSFQKYLMSELSHSEARYLNIYVSLFTKWLKDFYVQIIQFIKTGNIDTKFGKLARTGKHRNTKYGGRIVYQISNASYFYFSSLYFL